MTNKVKIALFVLGLAATMLLANTPAKADLYGKCPAGQSYLCTFGGDGGPWLCACVKTP